ncbi:hypothetical protein AAFF_G00023510 [Aldrovandia affinis]|uniref:Uncharacterized protein n=1 Tax=Aldrovandia affinis TaxID=143900 RepID=A0AAD7T6E8_9TELE|nr:hypothetical protein AAFF_G00023510 [Aldrovandia affinis]
MAAQGARYRPWGNPQSDCLDYKRSCNLFESDLKIPTSKARNHQVLLGNQEVTTLLDLGSAITQVAPLPSNIT